MIEISNDILKAKTILEHGNLVAIPTETVYGLAGNIYNDIAIKKIFEIKKRPFYNPLIVHLHSFEQLDEIAIDIPKKAKILAVTFWPGSLTLVLKKNDKISSLITADKNTVAVRIPNHPLTLELLKSLDFPLAAPSANPFGRISPTSAKHVADYFPDELQMVLDGGNCENGIESTIVGFENEEPVLYRYGSIAIEELEKIIGPIKVKTSSEKNPDAPGMLEKHYAPQTKTILTTNINEALELYKNFNVGLLLFESTNQYSENITVEILSNNKNLKEAAANLYAAMHRLDSRNLDLIIIEKFPDYDLGKSLNDRLQRAVK